MTGEVLAIGMSEGNAADRPLLPALVEESLRSDGSIAQASADGAYDSWANDPFTRVNVFLTEQGIVFTIAVAKAIPRRLGSKIRQHCHACVT